MCSKTAGLHVRRALISVSDKTGVVELAKALHGTGAEIVATGRTASVIEAAGIPVVPVEKISGSPEAFQGRMKTLSFAVCSGILFRRDDPSDEKDRERLGIQPIDCVVVNFYPFEAAAARGLSRAELVEEIDIGGPTLVRAAAKNAPKVLVLSSPDGYQEVIEQLRSTGVVSHAFASECAAEAWDKVLAYDTAIARQFGSRKQLRYGENPHQKAWLEVDAASPIAWSVPLTPNDISYNNVIDVSAAYELTAELATVYREHTVAVIVKHNNPCGVALVPKNKPEAQKLALIRAWEGDTVSAFGGVVVLSDLLEEASADWLSERFVELVAAPGLETGSVPLQRLLERRKKLKAVALREVVSSSREFSLSVVGARLTQTADLGCGTVERLNSVTERAFPEEKMQLAQFGVSVCRALKSNAIALVREIPGGFQLVGAGQGQPNRIDALNKLAIPRAQAVLVASGGKLADCVLVSDAFFPFRDSVDAAYAAGVRFIVQPGGSVRDKESVDACNEHKMAMALTGVRHFRH